MSLATELKKTADEYHTTSVKELISDIVISAQEFAEKGDYYFTRTCGFHSHDVRVETITKELKQLGFAVETSYNKDYTFFKISWR